MAAKGSSRGRSRGGSHALRRGSRVRKSRVVLRTEASPPPPHREAAIAFAAANAPVIDDTIAPPIALPAMRTNTIAAMEEEILRRSLAKMDADEARAAAAEIRAQEVHATLLQGGVVAGAGSVVSEEPNEDELGELSPLMRHTLERFSTIPAAILTSIFRNKFDPWNLYKLNSLDLNSNDNDQFILDGDKMEVRKNKGTAKNYSSAKVWSRVFRIYERVMLCYYGEAHPTLIAALLDFHDEVMELTYAYEWPSILAMVMVFHSNVNRVSHYNPDNWVLKDIWIQRHLVRQRLHAPAGSSKQPVSNNSFNNSRGISTPHSNICRGWNSNNGCKVEKCPYTHTCTDCGAADHGKKGHGK
jgi:hypothetical protein